MMLGDRSKCTRKRPLHQNAALRQQSGVFRGLVNTAVTCRGYSKDPKYPPRASPITFEPGDGVVGRRWRASLVDIAGGRRRRSRTKIAVISIKGTKTRYTHEPRTQTAHSERRWLARHTTAEHSREDTAD